jgi:O-antigen/teichoic acid export membrane protein
VNLKQKTISGLFWSFTDSFFSQGIQFIVGIILARILSPDEFGLIGMLTIFIAISQSMIDSGFSNALIRKSNCSQNDFSTVFYFNISTGILFYIILFASAGLIADFFNEPILKQLIRVLGIGIILSSLSLVQKTILTKELNFRLQMKISVIASSISGIISIIVAFKGSGVWSLVVLTLSKYGISTILLWIWSRWKFNWIFCVESFKELFSFGSKLLISGLIDTTYRNIYNIIIGKFFNARELGFYTRADQFQALPSQNLYGVISRVSYPVLSEIKDDPINLKMAYIKLIRSTMIITFILMLGLAAIAKPLIFLLVGEKWNPAVIYLQLLCFVGIFYPLHALNLNMLQVQGRSSLFLRLEIIKKCLSLPIIVLGMLWGIKVMIIGMIVNTAIAYYINSYWSGKLLGYSFTEQIKDIFPSFAVAFSMGFILFLESMFILIHPLTLLIIQFITGILFVISIGEIVKLKDYLYLKEILRRKTI